MPTLNGFQLDSGTISEPSTGLWLASLRAEMPELPAGQATIEIEGIEWTGAVSFSAFDFETASVFMIGGSGALGADGSVRDYVNPTVRSVVTGILDESGDVLSTNSDSAVLNAPLLHFHKSLLPRGVQLSSAIGSAVWYALRNGEIEIAQPDVFGAFEGNEEDFLEQKVDATNRSIRYAVQTPLLAPRITFEGRDLTYIETIVTPDTLQQVAYA